MQVTQKTSLLLAAQKRRSHAHPPKGNTHFLAAHAARYTRQHARRQSFPSPANDWSAGAASDPNRTCRLLLRPAHSCASQPLIHQTCSTPGLAQLPGHKLAALSQPHSPQHTQRASRMPPCPECWTASAPEPPTPAIPASAPAAPASARHCCVRSGTLTTAGAAANAATHKKLPTRQRAPAQEVVCLRL
jgi:hypothetical protein